MPLSSLANYAVGILVASFCCITPPYRKYAVKPSEEKDKGKKKKGKKEEKDKQDKPEQEDKSARRDGNDERSSSKVDQAAVATTTSDTRVKQQILTPRSSNIADQNAATTTMSDTRTTQTLTPQFRNIDEQDAATTAMSDTRESAAVTPPPAVPPKNPTANIRPEPVDQKLQRQQQAPGLPLESDTKRPGMSGHRSTVPVPRLPSPKPALSAPATYTEQNTSQRKTQMSMSSEQPMPFRPLSAYNDHDSESHPAKRRFLDNGTATEITTESTEVLSSFASDGWTTEADRKSASNLRTQAHGAKNRHKRPFSMMEAFFKNHDVLLIFVAYLDIPSLVSLYAISKTFHFLFNANHTAYIRASARSWAPRAEDIFPWRCYKALCIKDPCSRIKRKWLGKDELTKTAFEDNRDVPSLRWLQMVAYREGVCRDILIQLALNSLRCPKGTSDALKRMWFILDLPLNAYRIALVRSPEYISNRTLTLLTAFFLKLDMQFTDPVSGLYPNNHPNQRLNPNAWAGGAFIGVELREYLLAEASLTQLWRVLRGWSWNPSDPQIPMTRLDILRLWVRHKYTIPTDLPEHIQKLSIMGIPWWQVGAAGKERFGVPSYSLSEPDSTARPLRPLAVPNDNFYPHAPRLHIPDLHREPLTLLRPDQLVMMEAIRRKLSLHKQWIHMVCWGFVDIIGRPYPMYTEQEMNDMARGMPAKKNR